MRKLLLLLLTVLVLAAAGAAAQQARPAAAASQTVTISATGYKPAAISDLVGDTVVFSNTDTVAHTVAFKQTTGFNCTGALPLAVPAGQSASCTFTTAAKYSFSDPAQKGKAFHGTITVSKSATAGALTATPKVVVYGLKSTVAGTLATQTSGQSVQILAAECGSATSKLAGTVTTTTGGKFSFPAAPLKQTAYVAKDKSSTSPSVTVKVQPRLSLRKVSKHHYSLKVSAAQSFAGKIAVFQRYRSATKRWVTVKRVALKANSTGVAPTVITSAKFRSRIKPKVRVRVTLGSKQVGPCYVAGRSNTIRS